MLLSEHAPSNYHFKFGENYSHSSIKVKRSRAMKSFALAILPALVAASPLDNLFPRDCDANNCLRGEQCLELPDDAASADKAPSSCPPDRFLCGS